MLFKIHQAWLDKQQVSGCEMDDQVCVCVRVCSHVRAVWSRLHVNRCRSGIAFAPSAVRYCSRHLLVLFTLGMFQQLTSA